MTNRDFGDECGCRICQNNTKIAAREPQAGRQEPAPVSQAVAAEPASLAASIPYRISDRDALRIADQHDIQTTYKW